MFSFSLNMINVKENMRNYFGLKFRMDNSESQAMGSFKAIILHFTVLQSIPVLPQTSQASGGHRTAAELGPRAGPELRGRSAERGFGLCELQVGMKGTS